MPYARLQTHGEWGVVLDEVSIVKALWFADYWSAINRDRIRAVCAAASVHGHTILLEDRAAFVFGACKIIDAPGTNGFLLELPQRPQRPQPLLRRWAGFFSSPGFLSFLPFLALALEGLGISFGFAGLVSLCCFTPVAIWATQNIVRGKLEGILGLAGKIAILSILYVAVASAASFTSIEWHLYRLGHPGAYAVQTYTYLGGVKLSTDALSAISFFSGVSGIILIFIFVLGNERYHSAKF